MTNWTSVPADKKGKPKVRSNARSLRIKQKVVIGLLFFAAISGPLSCVTISRTTTPTVASTPYPTRVVAFATLVADDYLAGRPTVLPTATGVRGDFGLSGSESGRGPEVINKVIYSTVTSSAAYKATAVTLYTTTFRVLTTEGLFDLSITTMVDRTNQSVLAAAPSIIRSVVAQDDTIDAPNYEDIRTSVDVPVRGQAVVSDWAAAFAENNADSLKLLVNAGADGGAAPAGVYIGLGGFTVESLKVSPGIIRLDGLVYARVAVGFRSSSANGFLLSNEYDLLFTQFSSNDPRVVAWGVPGSGPTLRPFENNTEFQPSP